MWSFFTTVVSVLAYGFALIATIFLGGSVSRLRKSERREAFAIALVFGVLALIAFGVLAQM